MKKFLTLLISCSLALGATALAQQDQQQEEQKAKKQQAEKEHPAREGRQGANQQGAGRGQRGANKAVGQENAGAPNAQQTNAQKERGAGRGKGRGNANANAGAETKANTGVNANATASPAADVNAGANTNLNANPNAAAGGKGKGQAGRKGRGRNANQGANASTSASPVTSPAAQSPAPTAAAGAQTNAQTNAQANTANAQGNNRAGRGKQVDPQVVQNVKAQHQNFKAQPRPDRVPAVTFDQSRRIQGAEHWEGPQYVAFRSYHPEIHDQIWYRSHFPRVELIGGGYYYWNNGYWYPAWGYDRSAQYYPYDGPIYVGHNAEPPDKVIADVQAVLQQEGYYRGEVDGLLGPLTREALTAYQADHGLYTTAAIDQPTLDSLGMG